MNYPNYMTRVAGQLRSHRGHVLAALGLCSLLILFEVTSWRRGPVVEVITTVGNRPANTSQGTALHVAPQLPPRDVDVEAVGDKVAAATVYLRSRQSAAALRAMTQARAATAHAIEGRRQQGKPFDVLQDALKEMDSAEHSVRRGSLGDARARLVSLKSRLDDSLER